MAGALVHDLHALGPRALGEFALRFQFAELRAVIRVGNAAGAQTVADGERNVIRGHDVADVVPMRVEEIFLVMREAPLGHDAAAARNDAGHAARSHRHETQQHAGVTGEVIYALLGLFDERVAEKFPREIFGAAIDFFERLINRHGADGHGRVAQNPFARGVDVLAGGQIQMTVVSRPTLVAQRIIFSTSSSMLEATAELPMLALIFTRKLRPMIIGSFSG